MPQVGRDRLKGTRTEFRPTTNPAAKPASANPATTWRWLERQEHGGPVQAATGGPTSGESSAAAPVCGHRPLRLQARGAERAERLGELACQQLGELRSHVANRHCGMWGHGARRSMVTAQRLELAVRWLHRLCPLSLRQVQLSDDCLQSGGMASSPSMHAVCKVGGPP